MIGFAHMFPYKYVDTPLAGLAISAPWHGYHCHRGPLAGQSFTSQEDVLNKLSPERVETNKKTKAKV
jgi:hypothetical protein